MLAANMDPCRSHEVSHDHTPRRSIRPSHSVPQPRFHGGSGIDSSLGIGVNSTIFTVVKGVLLEPLPYPDAGRLVYVWETNRAVNKDRDPVAPLNYLDWKAETSVFESLEVI